MTQELIQALRQIDRDMYNVEAHLKEMYRAEVVLSMKESKEIRALSDRIEKSNTQVWMTANDMMEARETEALPEDPAGLEQRYEGENTVC